MTITPIVERIIEMLDEGNPVPVIANELGVTQSYCYKVRRELETKERLTAIANETPNDAPTETPKDESPDIIIEYNTRSKALYVCGEGNGLKIDISCTNKAALREALNAISKFLEI